MNKKIIIIFTLSFLLILLFLLYKGGTDSSKKVVKANITEDGKPVSNFRENEFPFMPMALYPHQEYESMLDSTDFINYDEFMEGIKTGKRNFVWEIWALREKCPADYTLDHCNHHILGIIEQNYSSPIKEELKRIFTAYFKYELNIRETGIGKSQGEFTERYQDLKKIRREFFSDEDANLVFGMEEAQIEFMEAAANFAKESEKLTGAEKVKKYETLKKQIYGAYYDAMVEREDKYQNYQTELNFKEEDFKNLSETEKTQALRSIQEKHFGKEEVERMLAEAKKEEDLRLEQENKIKEYESKEKEFLSDNENLSPEERDKKLSELRESILGKEEAESYINRKNIENISK
ncbi:MAG: lipase [Leptospiraceae bacterium]|nr:lipase [Leptospiraceae bacterium]